MWASALVVYSGCILSHIVCNKKIIRAIIKAKLCLDSERWCNVYGHPHWLYTGGATRASVCNGRCK